MPPSNDTEKCGSDLVGPGAKSDHNEFPSSHQAADIRRVKGAFLLFSVEARSYNPGREPQLKWQLSYDLSALGMHGSTGQMLGGEDHLPTLLWLLYLSLCGHLKTQTLTAGAGPLRLWVPFLSLLTFLPFSIDGWGMAWCFWTRGRKFKGEDPK